MAQVPGMQSLTHSTEGNPGKGERPYSKLHHTGGGVGIEHPK